MLKVRIKTDVSRIRKLRDHLRQGTGPVESVQDAHIRLYRAFLIRRFDTYSMGGGNWAPIKKSTARRKRSNKILVDTKFLRLHLAAAVDVLRRTVSSVTLAFISRMRHPTANMSIQELAEIHNQGLGNNPKREILVEPDQQTDRERARAGEKIIAEFLRGRR